MTDEKKARIYKSVQFMAIMAEMIKIEHLTDTVDAYFKNPLVNQFAKRIASDAKDIQANLKRNEKVMISFQDIDFIEEYAAELWSLFHFFIGLPISQIKEIMLGLSNAKIEVESPQLEDQTELYQAIYDTIDYALTGAELEGAPKDQGIKAATETICDMVLHSLNRKEVTAAK